ncbi:hypothetical protein H6B11_06560 [Mediterraneibacter glycyrrhizinilyticus]|nr:hypothetical protein [Mediterraneibacter glycyrrhizinilyticus]MBM6853818.1 hypothetical protein [Mediterraneibacter glycyrrhizinilyticus]
MVKEKGDFSEKDEAVRTRFLSLSSYFFLGGMDPASQRDEPGQPADGRDPVFC